MTKKGDRKVSKRILHVFNENHGVGMRFTEVSNVLAEKGWQHGAYPISCNLKFLIEQGKIKHVENQYCLVQTRENGSKFVIVKDPVERVVELE